MPPLQGPGAAAQCSASHVLRPRLKEFGEDPSSSPSPPPDRRRHDLTSLLPGEQGIHDQRFVVFRSNPKGPVVVKLTDANQRAECAALYLTRTHSVMVGANLTHPGSDNPLRSHITVYLELSPRGITGVLHLRDNTEKQRPGIICGLFINKHRYDSGLQVTSRTTVFSRP